MFKSGPEELVGKVYDLTPAPGLPLEFGIDFAVPALGGLHVHSFLEGGVSWHKEAEAEEGGIASGDYHEFFKIKVHRSLSEGEAPLVRSRLVTKGDLGNGLLTKQTTCPGPHKTHLRIEPYVGKPVFATSTSTATSEEENCGILKFEPKFSLTPSTTQQDSPIGVTADLAFPINEKFEEIENSDLRTSVTTLPEGMTINPAAVAGLEVCTPEQFSVGETTTEPEVACPPRSVIGTTV